MFNCIPENKRNSLLNHLVKLTEDESLYITIDSTNRFKWLKPFFLELGMDEVVSNMKHREINALSSFSRGRFFTTHEEVKKNDGLAAIEKRPSF
jgi:hypothetical protein